MAKTLSLVNVVGGGTEGVCAPFEPERRVDGDTGEGGTGAATTGLVGVPANLPCHASLARAVLVITVKRGEFWLRTQKSRKVESGNANLYYQDKCT